MLSYEMTDIHMHIIPGVDDGAADMDMALCLLKQAHEQGIQNVFATPHSSAFELYPEETPVGFDALKRQAKRYFPGIKLFYGCEVYCDENELGNTLQALSDGKYPSLNGTDYVLIEFSMWVRRDAALRCVERIAEAGWKPVIAHAERYKYLRFDEDLILRFRSAGALIQVNAYSAYEETDDKIREWARWILKNQKADFLGTDAHRTGHRPPNALTGLLWMEENLEADYFEAICRGNAQRLLLKKEGE